MNYKITLEYSDRSTKDLNSVVNEYQELGVPLEIKLKEELIQPDEFTPFWMSDRLATAIRRNVFEVKKGEEKEPHEVTAFLDEKQDLDSIEHLFNQAKLVYLECPSPDIKNLVKFLNKYDAELKNERVFVKKGEGHARICFNEGSYLQCKEVPAPEWACVDTFLEPVGWANVEELGLSIHNNPPWKFDFVKELLDVIYPRK